jgi:hypothetical protein
MCPVRFDSVNCNQNTQEVQLNSTQSSVAEVKKGSQMFRTDSWNINPFNVGQFSVRALKKFQSELEKEVE